MLSATVQVKQGKKLKRSGARETLEPTENKSGRDKQASAATAAAPDAVDTLPMTESQVDEALSGQALAVSDSQPENSPEPLQDSFCHDAGVDEKEHSQHLEDEHEQGEEEEKTFDEVVEPVLSHELAELMDEQAAGSQMDIDTQEQGTEEKTDSKGPEQTKETPTDTEGPDKTRAEVQTETANEKPSESRDLWAPPSAPLSPIGGSAEVLDSDEEAKHTKKRKKNEGQEARNKGTHKDSLGSTPVIFLISDFVFSSMLCHTMSGPNCLVCSSSWPRWWWFAASPDRNVLQKSEWSKRGKRSAKQFVEGMVSSYLL